VARDTFFGHNMVGQAEWERRGAATSAAASAISAALPVGVINAYYGTTAPSGWLLCDGAAIPAQYTALIALVGANTPNLKGRVLVGLNAAEAEFDTLGETGGAKTVTLSSAEMPSHNHPQDSHDHPQDSHTHGVTDPAHRHGFAGDTGFRFLVTTGSGVDLANPAAGGTQTPYSFGAMDTATTGVSINGETANNQATTATNQSAGSGGAHNNLPPYITISYIIKAVA
jgi:microcystin-dependent protein